MAVMASPLAAPISTSAQLAIVKIVEVVVLDEVVSSFVPVKL